MPQRDDSNGAETQSKLSGVFREFECDPESKWPNSLRINILWPTQAVHKFVTTRTLSRMLDNVKTFNGYFTNQEKAQKSYPWKSYFFQSSKPMVDIVCVSEMQTSRLIIKTKIEHNLHTINWSSYYFQRKSNNISWSHSTYKEPKIWLISG